MPLVPVLIRMEREGITIDTDFFKKFSGEIGERLLEIEAEVHDYVGHSFNLNSTQQLANVLFKDLKLEPPDRGKKTASGHYSTSAACSTN